MGAPEVEPEIRSKVARIIEAELRYRRRLGWTLGAWFVAGVVVGLATWFIQKPMDRDLTWFGAVGALGVGTFFFGGMLTRMLLRKPDTKCPQCGYDWKVKGESSENVLTWEFCPGCGLKLSDDTGCVEQR